MFIQSEMWESWHYKIVLRAAIKIQYSHLLQHFSFSVSFSLAATSSVLMWRWSRSWSCLRPVAWCAQSYYRGKALCKHFHFDLPNTTKIATLALKKNNLRYTHIHTHIHTCIHRSISYATVNMRSLRVTPALSRLSWCFALFFQMLKWNL